MMQWQSSASRWLSAKCLLCIIQASLGGFSIWYYFSSLRYLRKGSLFASKRFSSRVLHFSTRIVHIPRNFIQRPSSRIFCLVLNLRPALSLSKIPLQSTLNAMSRIYALSKTYETFSLKSWHLSRGFFFLDDLGIVAWSLKRWVMFASQKQFVKVLLFHVKNMLLFLSL